MSSFRNVIAVWIVALGVILSVDAFAGMNEYLQRSLQQHLIWIQGCTDNSVAKFSKSDLDLVIFSTDSDGGNGNIVSCLLPDSITDIDKQKSFIFPSPFDTRPGTEGGVYTYPNALIEVGSKVFIVTAPKSDWGVSGIKQIREDVFLVETRYSTHRRNYLVFGDQKIVRYLTNGSVEVVDEEELIFKGKWYKSYYNTGGAFWFDALIDRFGHFLDIVTPEKNENGEPNYCLGRDELSRKSHLDLSRVSDHKVCLHR